MHLVSGAEEKICRTLLSLMYWHCYHSIILICFIIYVEYYCFIVLLFIVLGEMPVKCVWFQIQGIFFYSDNISFTSSWTNIFCYQIHSSCVLIFYAETAKAMCIWDLKLLQQQRVPNVPCICDGLHVEELWLYLW